MIMHKSFVRACLVAAAILTTVNSGLAAPATASDSLDGSAPVAGDRLIPPAIEELAVEMPRGPQANDEALAEASLEVGDENVEGTVAVPEPAGAVAAFALLLMIGLMTLLRYRFDALSTAPAAGK